MKIGIDGNEANVPNLVGIGEYAYQILCEFHKIAPKDDSFTIYLKSAPLSHMPKENETWKYQIVRPPKLWTQFGLPLHLLFSGKKPQVFFTPTHYAPRFSLIPTAIAIMDMSFLHFPELFKKSDLFTLRNWTAYSARKAKRIFTISNASKNDIIKAYNIAEDKVVVTYPGIKPMASLEPHIFDQHTLKTKYGITHRYILFVGTLQPRKNIERLIEAFSKLESEKEAIQLVIVGKKGWLYEDILSAPERYRVAERVKFLESVPDDDLPPLYKHASFFILPSLYEGFGLPVLEAMKYNCPVITSNVSSLPEAADDAALYVDPLQVADMTEKMGRLLKDEKLRKDLQEKGKKQVAKFSWEKTAHETLRVLKNIVQKEI